MLKVNIFSIECKCHTNCFVWGKELKRFLSQNGSQDICSFKNQVFQREFLLLSVSEQSENLFGRLTFRSKAMRPFLKSKLFVVLRQDSI